MGNPNINKEGLETRFKKGQSGNPKGRAPKVLTSILKELKSKGYQEVKPDTGILIPTHVKNR